MGRGISMNSPPLDTRQQRCMPFSCRLSTGVYENRSGNDLLTDIQVRIVGEAGERDLVIARYVESKLAQAEVRAGLGPAIQDLPGLTLLDLMHELGRAHPDVKRAEGLLVELMGNDDLVCLLPVANDRPVEVILVDLEQDVVFGICVVEHPLQKAALDGQRGKG